MFISDLDVLLKLGNEEQLKKASAIADEAIKQFPKVLFFTKENLQRTGL